jgi:hypothetical protein
MNNNVKQLCHVKTLIVMASRKDDKKDEGTNTTILSNRQQLQHQHPLIEQSKKQGTV